MYNASIVITHHTATEYVYTLPNLKVQSPVVKLLMVVMRHWRYVPKKPTYARLPFIGAQICS